MLDETLAKTKITMNFMFLVLLVTLPSNANAQKDDRAIASEQSFRSSISAQVAAAAQKARVSLLPGVIAYAGGDGGFVVNAVIQGADRLGSPSLEKGMDLLFVYIGTNDLVVPQGYYKVRLAGAQAQFVASNGTVASTLPANVEQGTAAARGKVKVRGSVGWGKNGIEVDVEVTFGAAAARAVTVPIPRK